MVCWRGIARAGHRNCQKSNSSNWGTFSAYGLDSGIWTSPMIVWVIEEEFGVQYHPGHVRKLLYSTKSFLGW
jgi:hypothetical protein